MAKFPRLADYPRQGKQGWRRWVPSWKLVLGAGFSAFCLLVIAFGVIYSQTSIPQPNQLALAQSSVVYFSDGKTPIGTFQEVNRTSVPLTQVPLVVQHEVVSAEDRSFYTNKGIDPRGIARAFYNNVRGGAEQGGSTITQQYVKNYFLDQNRTLSRKFKEFFISIKIDRSTDKNAILQDYLNTIYFGRGAYGIQAASKAYFNKDVSQLTPAEGAVLASVIRAPALYDPALNLGNAQARWNYVMDGMVKGNYLTQAQVDALKYPKFLPRAKSSASGGTERLPARRGPPRGRGQAAPERQRHRPRWPADRHDLHGGRPEGRGRGDQGRDADQGRQGRAGRPGLDQAGQRRGRRDVRRAGLGQAAVQRGHPVHACRPGRRSSRSP